jgi:DNA-directed RNA polymerase sigma subunit (sigma70/sigma32)
MSRPLPRCTLEEVGRELGVTTERAWQIEATALLKLRRWCARNGLRFEDLVGG